MKKYTKELKLKVVRAYLNQEGGVPTLLKRFKVSSTSRIQDWIKIYTYYGEAGFDKKKNTKYSTKCKLDVINYREANKKTAWEAAKYFGLNNPALIFSWEHQLTTQGIAGLSKPRGRPAIKMKHEKMTDKKKIKILEQEKERLELENMYLKKLEAYLENPSNFLDGHNSKQLKVSKKKDLD